jgi:hypothetical protein
MSFRELLKLSPFAGCIDSLIQKSTDGVGDGEAGRTNSYCDSHSFHILPRDSFKRPRHSQETKHQFSRSSHDSNRNADEGNHEAHGNLV